MPKPATSSSKYSYRYILDVLDEVGDPCLSELVVEGRRVGGEGVVEDSCGGDADPSHNRVSVVPDEVGGGGSGVEAAAAVDNHVISALS